MAEAGALVGALGAFLAIFGRSRPAVVSGIAALGAAELVLARELVPSTSSLALAALGVAGALAIAALAALFIRFPGVVPAVVVGVAPFRLPFEVSAENRFLVGLGEAGALGRLVPLYVVLAASAVALVWRAIRGDPLPALPWALTLPAALLVALMTASLVWAYDPVAAEDRLAFFVVPFAVLLAVVSRAPFRPWLPRVLAVEAVALACLFAAVGLGEAWARELLFYDPKVAVANEYTSYFRVTSLFSDPSIYGRHVVAAIAVLVVVLWLARISFALGALLIAFLWAGLYFSYSQSSMLALAAATVVVTFLVADARVRRWLAGAAVALALVGAVTFATLLRDEPAERVTSGRSTLVEDTWTVFSNHPLAGVGVASQPAASRDEAAGARRERRNVSHTAPLTIAAELGVLGIVLYVAFLAGVVRVLWAVRARDEALGLALLAVAVVLFVHSLVYGVFFDDPVLWATLGIACAAAVARAPVRAVEPLRAESRRSEPAPAAR
jgi:putative inorganic carbon (hco3(-)) transporter